MAEPSSAAPAAAAALKMLKVKCSLEDCPVFFLRQGSRLPLCAGHSIARDGMYQQASRSRNKELVDTLLKMEKENLPEFLEHLRDFA